MLFNFKPFNTLTTITAAVALALSVSLSATEEQTELPLEELRTFAEVFNQIRIGYVEEIDDSTLLEFAIASESYPRAQGLKTGSGRNLSQNGYGNKEDHLKRQVGTAVRKIP